ncbi:MAG TPA: sulfatase-like hydrolase/transferase [Thermoguttaceae bacterium]|nr:sulfatase-like hydrolase/transferase [Thermoguttaceae bacterium]HUU97337.1 sulfatase-like hydrolase/transferase [Phycisphaerae bacterium]
MRRLFFLVLCASPVCILSSPASAEQNPNIVLMMADDQGWGETGYNGHPHLKTPVLDEMAAEGLRLDRFYAASPVCSPTRASVMTGRHANRSGAFAPNWSTRPEEITLAHILKQAGYRTGHFGKWHIGAVKRESPLNPNKMGFDEYLSHDNFFEMNPPLSRNGAPPEIIHGESSEIIVEEAVCFARKVHGEQKPFFIVVWFGSPHGPYSGLDKDVAIYRDVPNEQMRLRFAEITAMDRAIGAFRAALRDLGAADNTLLWFNSDNGIPVANEEDSFNGGWRGRKGDVYEGGLLVPAIIQWPAVIRTPRASSVPCVTSDILPTVLDLLDLEHPDSKRPLDGVSLRELIVDGTMTARPSPIGFWKYPAGGEKKNGRWVSEELSRGTTPTTRNPAIDFTNYRHPVAKTEDFGGDAAWTDNRFKLVTGRPRRGEPRTELFDLVADPKETTNIAEEHPDVVERMRGQLHQWQRSVEQSLTGADY